MEVLFIFGLVAIIAVGAYQMYAKKKKNEENQLYATDRGWTYHKKHPTFARQAVQAVKGGRDSNTFQMVFEGRDNNVPFYAGTAVWTETTGSGDDRKTSTYYRKLIMRPLGLNVQGARIEKETVFNNMFNRDIKTEWEEFNKAWKISSNDHRFVHALLAPAMQEWLMRNTDLNFFVSSGWLYVYAVGRLEKESVDHYIRVSNEFREKVPEFLWQDYGTGGGNRRQ